MTAMHDIFISYAHRDDQSPAGRECGWVTTLKHWLTVALGRALGRDADIWMDYALVANAQVTPTLIDTVRSSRALLLVLSPSYQNSEWCQRELANFLDNNPPGGDREAVFVVEQYPVDRLSLHPRLQELTPVQFWVPDANTRTPELLGWPVPNQDEHNPYWEKVNYLANLLANHLRAPLVKVLQRPPAAAAGASPVVWVAGPAPRMAGYWDQLTESMRLRGWTVRPVSRDGYPQDGVAALREALDRDMDGARLLVQLLGDEPGVRLPGSDATLATVQHAAAKALQQSCSGMKYLRWRPPEIDLEQVEDPDLREILFGATRCGFEQFRQQVLEALDHLKPPPPPAPAGDGMTICLAAGEKDQALCDEVGALLVERGWDVVSPSPVPESGENPQTFRETVDEIIRNSDAVVVLYGRESHLWIEAQYARTVRLLGRQNLALGVIEAPPGEKPPLKIASRNLQTLDCRGGIERDAVAGFIARLGAEHHG